MNEVRHLAPDDMLYFVDRRRMHFGNRTRKDENAVQIRFFDWIRNQLSRTDLIVKSRHRHDRHADAGNEEPPDRFDGIDHRLDTQPATEARELLFDQRVGDLFVVRVAGNVVLGAGAAVKGSVEYAVAVLNVPLVMVLGHSKCGAVEAALKRAGGGEAPPGAIKDLVGLIQAAADKVKDRPGDKLRNAIRANVEVGVERLRTLRPVLAERVKEGRLKVVGAVYDLRTGRVELVP